MPFLSEFTPILSHIITTSPLLGAVILRAPRRGIIKKIRGAGRFTDDQETEFRIPDGQTTVLSVTNVTTHEIWMYTVVDRAKSTPPQASVAGHLINPPIIDVFHVTQDLGEVPMGPTEATIQYSNPAPRAPRKRRT